MYLYFLPMENYVCTFLCSPSSVPRCGSLTNGGALGSATNCGPPLAKLLDDPWLGTGYLIGIAGLALAFICGSGTVPR